MSPTECEVGERCKHTVAAAVFGHEAFVGPMKILRGELAPVVIRQINLEWERQKAVWGRTRKAVIRTIDGLEKDLQSTSLTCYH